MPSLVDHPGDWSLLWEGVKAPCLPKIMQAYEVPRSLHPQRPPLPTPPAEPSGSFRLWGQGLAPTSVVAPSHWMPGPVRNQPCEPGGGEEWAVWIPDGTVPEAHWFPLVPPWPDPAHVHPLQPVPRLSPVGPVWLGAWQGTVGTQAVTGGCAFQSFLENSSVSPGPNLTLQKRKLRLLSP